MHTYSFLRYSEGELFLFITNLRVEFLYKYGTTHSSIFLFSIVRPIEYYSLCRQVIQMEHRLNVVNSTEAHAYIAYYVSTLKL
jgi:hypothetical protein